MGLEGDLVPGHATGTGRPHAKRQSRPDVKEPRQTEEQSLKEQQYLRHLLELQDRDRQMVSYEIHDGFVQQLAGAIMQFAAFSRLKGEGDGEVWKCFAAGRKALDDCMREARQLISGLRSPILDELGVVAALEDFISQGSAQGKPEIDFVHQFDGERLAPALENTIYRIIQESLTNARRYSQSDRVLVRLTRRERCLRIDVAGLGHWLQSAGSRRRPLWPGRNSETGTVVWGIRDHQEHRG